MVGIGVLFGVVVVPVVVLTWCSLWLYGFSTEVIWRNVGGTGLAVAGLWFAVCFFCKVCWKFEGDDGGNDHRRGGW